MGVTAVKHERESLPTTTNAVTGEIFYVYHILLVRYIYFWRFFPLNFIPFVPVYSTAAILQIAMILWFILYLSFEWTQST